MRWPHILLLQLLFLTTNTFAFDEFNAFRWNRKNVTEQNNQIDTRPWFEWWYYKVVIPETREAFYFVYGVVNPWDSKYEFKGTRSYVGFGDFQAHFNVEDVFSLDDFTSKYDETFITVGDNQATDKSFRGQISKEGEDYSWDIDIKHRWSFNATGWATGKNWTNIEWYPAQADASCSGVVESKGRTYKFQDAPCYQDRNWGFSFPDWWTWIVSNSFDNHPETALAIGGGKPTFFGRFKPIEGVAVGLVHQGVEYSWRPNDLDKVRIAINFGKWEVTAINEDYKIEIVAEAAKDQFMDLEFVTPKGEVFHDYEALKGEVKILLYKKPRFLFSKWELKERLTSHLVGIEYGSYKSFEKGDWSSFSQVLYSNF